MDNSAKTTINRNIITVVTQVEYNMGMVKVVEIPKDGNCLFKALGHQIFKHPIDSQLGNTKALLLRDEVAQYIMEHSDTFNESIKYWFYAEQDTKLPETEKWTETDMIRAFCDNIRKPGIWGGEESIVAISNIYKVKVEIYIEKGGKIVIQGKNARGIVRIAYRGEGGTNHNHYDSIVKVQKRKGTEENKKNEHMNQNWLDSQVNIGGISRTQEIGYTIKINAQSKEHKNFQKKSNIKVASWNVRGSVQNDKRENIDSALDDERIDVAGLQETHLNMGTAETDNYIWWTAGNKKGGKEPRGTAILIRKNSNAKISKFKPISGSLCSANLEWNGHALKFITAHIGSESDKRSKSHLEDLNREIAIALQTQNIILMGDLNAHFGVEDRDEKEKRWIGDKLGHQYTNENGIYIKNLITSHRLVLHNSWNKDRSTLITWSNGTSSSQIDHIISSLNKDVIGFIKAKWIGSVSSDHKIIKGIILGEKMKYSKQLTRRNTQGRWHINEQSIETQENYNDEIKVQLTKKDLTTNHPKTVPEKWQEIKETIKEAAYNTLSAPGSPMTPNRRKAIANQKRARFLRSRFPRDEEFKIDLKNTNITRKEADRKHVIRKWENLLTKINILHPLQRSKELYKILKTNGILTKKKTPYIPMNKWEEIMRKDVGDHTELIEEKDNRDLPAAPNAKTISRWVKEGKKGRAPGTDNISLDLLYNAPPQLINEITNIIKEAWEENIIPEEWGKTVQVPIPKINNPRGTNDFRRITLCNSIYKLYAKHLLHCVDSEMPPLPAYQAAFAPDRSTDDHLFTTGRILEERWRGGLKTFILSIDLEKAFDTVLHNAIISILKHNNIQHKVINRIIKACLNETTAIQWCGQRSQDIKKSRGVKQGCPLSPRLFNIVIDEVFKTAAETLPFIDLEHNNGLNLPIILVFADDILLIDDQEERLQVILDEINPLFNSVGLKINGDKTHLIIRDPLAIVKPSGNLTLDNRLLNTSQNMKYLGLSITSSINRKTNICEKIKKAHKIAHSLYPFLLRSKLPWKIVRMIYESMVVPAVTYGLKTMVLTRSNRIRLREMERDIVKLMTTHCRPRIKDTNANRLLKNQTIIRKIAQLRIRYWGHITRRPEGHILKRSMEYQTKKRKIGRPCMTWNTALEMDKQKFDLEKEDWDEILGNRTKTATLTKVLFQIPDKSDSEDELEKK